ncbi:MAG TPA: hypothetical protein VGC87_06250 [Pyrinomonadaceae bacterium]|jgi:hypothetical protein
MPPRYLKMNQDQLRGLVGRIYDAFCNASLSRKYYSHRLTNYRIINRWYEIVLGVGSSATVAAWSLWKVPGGANFWTAFAGAIAVLALIKPFLPLSNDIERFSKLHTGYTDLYYDLQVLIEDLKTNSGVTKDIADRAENAEKRYKELALQDDPKVRKRLHRKCEEEVRKAFPTSYFWKP